MIRYQITNGSIPARSGVDIVQIRNHEIGPRELCGVVRAFLMAAPGARILVNDRADVAIACGAHGVHLRDGAISPRIVRRLGNFIVSAACHDAEGVRRAEEEGADYAVLAPIFSPLSKPAARGPLGIDALRRIARSVSIPVIALGGITESNAAQCVEAGAAGVAGITLFGNSGSWLPL